MAQKKHKKQNTSFKTKRTVKLRIVPAKEVDLIIATPVGEVTATDGRLMQNPAVQMEEVESSEIAATLREKMPKISNKALKNVIPHKQKFLKPSLGVQKSKKLPKLSEKEAKKMMGRRTVKHTTTEELNNLPDPETMKLGCFSDSFCNRFVTTYSDLIRDRTKKDDFVKQFLPELLPKYDYSICEITIKTISLLGELASQTNTKKKYNTQLKDIYTINKCISGLSGMLDSELTSVLGKAK